MNLPYIQSELFRELVGMETLLKPEIYMSVVRCRESITVNLFRNTGSIFPDPVIGFELNCDTITTADQITAEINRIWNSIPAECKKPNTWI